MACRIAATVESMLTMTPFLSPRETWVPMPMTSTPSSVTSPTTAAIFVVPMSRPTMMSELRLAMCRLCSLGSHGWDRFALHAHRDEGCAADVQVNHANGADPDATRFHSFEDLIEPRQFSIVISAP